MLHSEPSLMIICEYLRQEANNYINGRKMEEQWKKEFNELGEQRKKVDRKSREYKNLCSQRKKRLEWLEDYWLAEEFFFWEENEHGIEWFFEKYSLDSLGDAWTPDYFRKMVKNGHVVEKGPNKGDIHAYYKGKKPDGERVLDDNDGEGGVPGRSDTTGIAGACDRDCESFGRQATALAGCVC